MDTKPSLLYAVCAEWFEKIFSVDTLQRVAKQFTVIPADVPEHPDTTFIMEHVREAEILITSWETAPVDAAVLSNAPKLKLVAHAAGSVKAVMSEAAWTRGLRATSAAPAIAVSVAEFCLGLILTVPKRMPWLTGLVRRGYWRETRNVFGPAFEIYGERIGIIGASLVGRKLIDLLRPFDCEIMLYDPYCSAEDAAAMGVAKADAIETIFAECQVVSLHAPSTPETRGMIRGGHLALLSPGSLFINTARGDIVNQKEMIEELQKGRFVACLDVTAPEPPTLHDPLRTLPNVLLTPHIAGGVNQNLRRVGDFIGTELLAYAEGRSLLGEITYEKLPIIA